MSRFLLWLAVLFRICPKPKFRFRKAKSQANVGAIRDCEVVVITDGGYDKWACLKCPGGCGEVIRLNLSPKRRPSWRARQDRLARPTLEPSVWQQNECGCHFFVRDGEVVWYGSEC